MHLHAYLGHFLLFIRGCATIEALVVSHFFPALTPYVWAYTGVLYWATMYLTHHYLIDVVGGACLATAFFYFFLPAELDSVHGTGTTVRSKYEQYDLEAPPRARRRTVSAFSATSSLDSQDEEEQEIAYRSPLSANGNPINSGVPFLLSQGSSSNDRDRSRRSHKHTASIASLIRADERVEDGWSPIVTGFGMSPSPLRPNGEMTIENGIPRTRTSSPISNP